MCLTHAARSSVQWGGRVPSKTDISFLSPRLAREVLMVLCSQLGNGSDVTAHLHDQLVFSCSFSFFFLIPQKPFLINGSHISPHMLSGTKPFLKNMYSSLDCLLIQWINSVVQDHCFVFTVHHGNFSSAFILLMPVCLWFHLGNPTCLLTLRADCLPVSHATSAPEHWPAVLVPHPVTLLQILNIKFTHLLTREHFLCL